MFSDELYRRIESIDNPSDDLRAYCNAIGEMFSEVESLAREDSNGNLPWSKITDPELALNTASLLWLAQLAGVRVPVGMELESMRDFIELAESRRRGTEAYMVEVAQRLLTGEKSVFVLERDGSAYVLTINTRTAETPDAAAVEAALRAIKPAGIVLNFSTVGGFTWNEAAHTWNAAGLVSWDESLTVLP